MGTEQCQITRKFNDLEEAFNNNLQSVIGNQVAFDKITSVKADVSAQKLFYHDSTSQHNGKSSGNAVLNITVELENGDRTTRTENVTGVLFLSDVVNNQDSNLNVVHNGKTYGIVIALHTDSNLYGQQVNKTLFNTINSIIGDGNVSIEEDGGSHDCTLDSCLESRKIMVPHFFKDALLDNDTELTETVFTTHNLKSVIPKRMITDTAQLGALRGQVQVQAVVPPPHLYLQIIMHQMVVEE